MYRSLALSLAVALSLAGCNVPDEVEQDIPAPQNTLEEARPGEASQDGEVSAQAGTCHAGWRAGQYCNWNSDCGKYCSTGPKYGQYCTGDANCGKLCAGGSRYGYSCFYNSDCPGSYCLTSTCIQAYCL